MPDTSLIPATNEATPIKPYTGKIRVAWINESRWMRAGDLGTIRNAINALGEVEKIVEIENEMSGEDMCFQESLLQGHVKQSARLETWQKNAAQMVRPLIQNNPEKIPLVVVSTGQTMLRPIYSALRKTLPGSTVWLDLTADVSRYDCYTRSEWDESHDAPTINAVLCDKIPTRRDAKAKHKWVELPYLPPRKLPPREEARARLTAHYGGAFDRPLMAILVGFYCNYCDVAKAARLVSADLAVTTSPRTSFSEYEYKTWQQKARIFYKFGKSKNPNPYADLLAAADYIAVDGDSYSMASEAMATGVPVIVLGDDKLHLAEDGLASRWDADSFPCPPPHEKPGDILNRAVRTELARVMPGLKHIPNRRTRFVPTKSFASLS